MRLLLGAGVALSLGAGAAHAAAYGEAGCGLGSVVMGKDGNQILAATTNATFWTQTFGISSGTLNCAKDSAIARGREAEAFAEANYAALMRQIAAGQGEYLTGFARIVLAA